MRTFDELMTVMRGFQEARVLLTAVELDVFTAAGGAAKAAEIAARIKAEPRATEMLLNALVALGALEKNGNLFRCTGESARFQAARAGTMHTVNLWDTWSTLTACVRQGTAVRKPGVDAQEAEWTEAFIAAMHANAMQQAWQMVEAVGAAGVRRLLDVGGGSGAYAIAFAQANPELRSEVLDLAPVCRIAERHIGEAGLSARVRTRTGDLTKDEFGSGYDLILLSAICHMLSEQENLDLLKRCARALSEGGRVVIRDFILEEGRTSPPRAAMFSLNMLVGTRRGNCYTEAEYAGWLRTVGFRSVERAGADLVVGRI